MILNEQFLNTVSSQAKGSPRLRMNYNLHESLDDTTHRFFNAMEPGTIVPIHRHRGAAETFILVRGKMRVVLYDDDKSIIEETSILPTMATMKYTFLQEFGIGLKSLKQIL